MCFILVIIFWVSFSAYLEGNALGNLQQHSANKRKALNAARIEGKYPNRF
uniref:Uncharacterized protein n=1 Tax=Anguilla anguilla TaxID=7936 RepID=A0A0E9SFS0_ANGAN